MTTRAPNQFSGEAHQRVPCGHLQRDLRAYREDKAYQVTKSEKPEGRTELIVYWCHSVERGPEHRVFDEVDIQAAGCINGIEMELQRDSCWFVRLGVIEAQEGASGWSYPDEAIAALPEPDLREWSLGRHNPAFSSGAFERHIFESLFRSLSALLKSWAHEERRQSAPMSSSRSI